MKTMTKQSLVRGLTLVLVAFAAAGSTGCATMLKGKTETVSLQSNPGDAEVYIDGAPRGRTPLMLELQPNKDYTVVFKKPGYADQAQVITSSVSGKWVVLDVVAGLVPLVVDVATGSWKELDNKLVNVTLAARDDEERELARDDEDREDDRDADRAPPAGSRRGSSRERRARPLGAERSRPAHASDSLR